MKIITTIHETFGPFYTVEILSDRYLINGNLEIQFDVIGDSEVVDVPSDWQPQTQEEFEEDPSGGLPPFPEFVTRRQAMMALLLNKKDGTPLLDLVPLAISAIEDEIERRTAEIYWKESLTFQRDEPLIHQIGAALGLTTEYIRLLFVQANEL